MSIFSFLLMISLFALPLIAIGLYIAWIIISHRRKLSRKLLTLQLVLPIIWSAFVIYIANFDFLTTLLLPFAPLAIVPYFIWIHATFKRKQSFVIVILQLVVPLLWFGVILTGAQLENQDKILTYTNQTFGITTYLEKPLFHFETERTFNGDGYSFNVYTLTPNLVKQFTNTDQAWLQTHPIWPEFRSHWKVRTHWLETPLDDKFQVQLKFALAKSAMYVPDTPKIVQHRNAIRTALQQPGAFYAIAGNMHDKSLVGDVNFYLIDLKNKRLYIINHNT